MKHSDKLFFKNKQLKRKSRLYASSKEIMIFTTYIADIEVLRENANRMFKNFNQKM